MVFLDGINFFSVRRPDNERVIDQALGSSIEESYTTVFKVISATKVAKNEPIKVQELC